MLIEDPTPDPAQTDPAEVLVGRRLKEIRLRRGLSLRALADRSRLNVNTLSLVENGKSSPSVGTLQQMAEALEVPITAFFESTPVEKLVVYTPADKRPQASFGSTRMENLGRDLAGNAVQPFLITLEPGVGSGDTLIVHTGHEFVFCLSGSVYYKVDQQDFELRDGDSLVFNLTCHTVGRIVAESLLRSCSLYTRRICRKNPEAAISQNNY